MQQRTGQKQQETLRLAWGKLRLKSLSFEVPEGMKARQVRLTKGNNPITSTFTQQDSHLHISLASDLMLNKDDMLQVTIQWM